MHATDLDEGSAVQAEEWIAPDRHDRVRTRHGREWVPWKITGRIPSNLRSDRDRKRCLATCSSISFVASGFGLSDNAVSCAGEPRR